MTVVTDVPIGQDVVGNVRLVAIDQLRTSYMRLRPGAVPPGVAQGSELPLRVAPCADSPQHFELLDGFKRVGRWREQGATLVPVVVEEPARVAEHKRLMLTVNAPVRTTTVLDEARVVCSLLDDDGMTPRQVSRLLGRKPAWVDGTLASGFPSEPKSSWRWARWDRRSPTRSARLRTMSRTPCSRASASTVSGTENHCASCRRGL